MFGSSRHIKVTFPTLTVIEKSINLQYQEVAALWTPIYGVVHPGHWNPSQFRTFGREHYDALRTGSHKIVRDMIEHLTFGGYEATMTVSVDARFRMLLSSSVKKIVNPLWPELHPELPPSTSVDSWNARPEFYPSAAQSNGLRILLCCIGGIPSVYGASVNPSTIDINRVVKAMR
jgi:hypothetical protein